MALKTEQLFKAARSRAKELVTPELRRELRNEVRGIITPGHAHPIPPGKSRMCIETILSRIPTLNHNDVSDLINHFANLDELLLSNSQDLTKLPFIGPLKAESIILALGLLRDDLIRGSN